MPWRVGIDEAGYGPNLGPLVQTAVGIRAEHPDVLTSQSLSRLFRRCDAPKDERILIDDSKKLFSAKRDLRLLEESTLSTLTPSALPLPTLFEKWLACTAPASVRSVQQEPWFVGTEMVPLEVDVRAIANSQEFFTCTCDRIGIVEVRCFSIITTPREFNALLENGWNKADITAAGVSELFRRISAGIDSAETVEFCVDRQGGRRYYRELIENAFPDVWIRPLQEEETCSCYETFSEPKFRWSFATGADASDWTVAWASMMCKYVRERLMGQFNAYWRRYCPHLRPTAGYPLDARRFLSDIEHLISDLHIPLDWIWRRR